VKEGERGLLGLTLASELLDDPPVLPRPDLERAVVAGRDYVVRRILDGPYLQRNQAQDVRACIERAFGPGVGKREGREDVRAPNGRGVQPRYMCTRSFLPPPRKNGCRTLIRSRPWGRGDRSRALLSRMSRRRCTVCATQDSVRWVSSQLDRADQKKGTDPSKSMEAKPRDWRGRVL
jgi:hypothetical protein